MMQRIPGLVYTMGKFGNEKHYSFSLEPLKWLPISTKREKFKEKSLGTDSRFFY
jgi:hypothetical protein